MRATSVMVVGPLLALSAACVDLDVANPNQPDISRALASPAAVAAVAEGAVHTWYLTATSYQGNLMLMVTADHATSNFCHGTRFNNEEPRIPYNNQAQSGDEIYARRPWERFYEALGDANAALAALDRGVEFAGDVDATERVRAAALFAQAGSLTYLGLMFDRGFAITAPPEGNQLPTLRDYPEVLDSARAAWDRLIALTEGKTWSWDASVLPLGVGPASASHLNRIARTMAARTLVYAARTPVENAATDWAAVLAYADGGLTGNGVADLDFAVVDDYDSWWDYVKNYGAWHAWLRVDQRLINRMASNIPSRFNGLGNQPTPVPEDDRLAVASLPCTVGDPSACTAGITADYVYLGYVIGEPSRGLHKMSPFWHRRYEKSSFGVPADTNIGIAAPHILAAENDLLIAEALARTGGDLARAAALVNKTHVGRGGRAPVAATVPAVLAGVDYERDVELLTTSGMIGWWDRRRLSATMFNDGTFRQLPVPARELETLGLPVYSYGGVGQPDM